MMRGSGTSVSSAQDSTLLDAIKRIENDYGDIVSVDEKRKALLKYGRNKEVGTATTGYTLMILPSGETAETYVYTNAIDSISSSNTNDDQAVVVEGHTISGNSLTFVSQTATLNGQNRVALGTSLARVTRLYNASTTNDDTIAGKVYVFENDTLSAGVPQTATKIHLTTDTARQQSQKASTSISSVDYWIVTSFYASVLEKTSAFADVELQVRTLPGVFRQQVDIAASSSSGTVIYNFNPYLIVPKNSDVRLQAVASAASTDVAGGINGYLAKVIR